MFSKFKRASRKSSLLASSRSTLAEATEVPSGPLEDCLTEFADFDRLLQDAETCRQEVAEALARFRAAATPLLDGVRNFNFRQHSCQDALAQLCAEFDGCTGHLQASEACSHAMQQRIEQARTRCSQAHEALEVRKELWATKLHCNEEAARINRRGSTASMEQKSARLKANQEAEEAFQSIGASTLIAVEACLEDAWPSVQLILAELVCVYSALLMPIEHLASDTGRFAATPSSAAGLESINAKCGPLLPLPATSGFSAPLPVRSRHYPISELTPCSQESPNLISELTSCGQDFSQGEAVQVWSASQNAWLEGHVERVYEESCKEDSFTVPAGVVKVSSAAGVKYVRSEHVATTLRKMAAKAG